MRNPLKSPPTSFRLNAQVEKLLDSLAKAELTTRTGALEIAVKEAAKKRGIKAQEESDAS